MAFLRPFTSCASYLWRRGAKTTELVAVHQRRAPIEPRMPISSDAHPSQLFAEFGKNDKGNVSSDDTSSREDIAMADRGKGANKGRAALKKQDKGKGRARSDDDDNDEEPEVARKTCYMGLQSPVRTLSFTQCRSYNGSRVLYSSLRDGTMGTRGDRPSPPR